MQHGVVALSVNQPTPLGKSTSRRHKMVRSSTLTINIINHSTRNRNKENIASLKEWDTTPTDKLRGASKTAGSILPRPKSAASSAASFPSLSESRTCPTRTISSSACPLTLVTRTVSLLLCSRSLQISLIRSPSFNSSVGQELRQPSNKRPTCRTQPPGEKPWKPAGQE